MFLNIAAPADKMTASAAALLYGLHPKVNDAGRYGVIPSFFSTIPAGQKPVNAL